MDSEIGNKRQRTYSGGTTLTARIVTENLQRYGEIILHCTVNITHGIREYGNSMVLKCVCALLNSGGGILHMKNIDIQRGPVLSKHLDTWWSGMECKMADIVSKDDICNYFDLVGNHDDADLYLFVKTAEHLCTLDFNCRLPTDTATHDVTYQSVMKLVTNRGVPDSLDNLPPIPAVFIYGRTAERTKKETKQIQFKQLSNPNQRSGKGLPGKIKSLMLKYVSAFANHEGGHIFFGIDDVRASVIGEELNMAEQRETENLVTERMKLMIWGDENTSIVRGKHWDIQFFPVENLPRKYHRVVVVISVCKFLGCVFTSCPESYYVNGKGQLVDLSFSLWRDTMLNPLRDVPELHCRFMKLPMNVPTAPLVFTLPNTVEDIKKKSLTEKKDGIAPRHFVENFAGSRYMEEIKTCVENFETGNSVCIGLECWGLKIPISCTDVLCDIMVINDDDGLHVLTFVNQIHSGVQQHAQTAAALLKNKLVTQGGFRHKFGVTSHIIDVRQVQNATEWEKNVKNRELYPSHFSIRSKFDTLIRSLVICMASYRANIQNSGNHDSQGSYKFVLTHDQFELLWTQQFTKELWVHGPPGAGKTVAAIQLMQELRRRGCSFENLLYLAENERLCAFVMDHDICMVSTRRALLEVANDSTLLQRRYGQICNVIVDEAQNFKDWDGDWYALAEKLASQKAPEYLHRCCNYFWVFMDYSQKVHKFKAGLPSVIGKNNFMLSEVSRSTKEIFEFTSRLMMASDNVEGVCNPFLRHVGSTPKLAHSFSAGKGVDILSCQESALNSVLSRVLSGLAQKGVKENDIAILVGRKSELHKLHSSLKALDSNLTSDENKDTEMTKATDLKIKNKDDTENDITDIDTDTAAFKNTSSASDTAVDQKKDSELLKRDLETENITDTSESDSFEISNQFGVLSDCLSENEISFSDDEVDTERMEVKKTTHKDNNKALATHVSKATRFYGQDSDDESSDIDNVEGKQYCMSEQPYLSKEPRYFQEDKKMAVDTVKSFSGLDKAAVVGINPEVNEEHADFNRFVLSLASRARDNLVIITTSDSVKDRLDKYNSFN